MSNTIKATRQQFKEIIDTLLTAAGFEYDIYDYLPSTFNSASRVIFINTSATLPMNTTAGTSGKRFRLFVTVAHLFEDPEFPDIVNPQVAQDFVDDVIDVILNVDETYGRVVGYWDQIEILDYAETFLNERDDLIYWFASVPIEVVSFT